MNKEKILYQYNIKKESKQFLYWSLSNYLLAAFVLITLFIFPDHEKVMLPFICFFFFAGIWFFIMYLFGHNYQIKITKTEFIFTAIFKTKRYNLKDLKKYEYHPVKNKWYVFKIFFEKETIKPVISNKQELKGLLNYLINHRNRFEI